MSMAPPALEKSGHVSAWHGLRPRSRRAQGFRILGRLLGVVVVLTLLTIAFLALRNPQPAIAFFDQLRSRF